MTDASLDDLNEEPIPRQKPVSRDWSPEDRKTLAQAILRGSLVVVSGVLALALNDLGPDSTATIIGATALAIAGGTLIVEFFWRSQGTDDFTLLWQAAALAVVGILLLSWPGATVVVVGRLIGVGILVLAANSLVRGIRTWGSPNATWLVARSVLIGFVGAFSLLFPSAVAVMVLWGLAIAWALGAVTSAAALILRQPRPDLYDEPVEPMRITIDWLRRYEMSAEQRAAVSDKLYFEGDAYRARLWRFAVLMFLSTTIATFGVAADSTAVVIGAMLIAPLMTPIMGLTGALVMAWPRRAARAGAIVAGGMALAVAVAWTIVGFSPQISQTVLESSQVTSRTTPTLLDLGIALAAGAAGAFAISRPDVSDSLPGVAIAVALVPPLAVVGTTLQLEAWEDAVGATLLFVTNLVAIILAGGVVFVLTGFTPMHRVQAEGHRIRLSFAAVGVAALIIMIPLAITTRIIIQDGLGHDEAEASVRTWLVDTDLEVVQVKVDGNDVDVAIEGSDEPPPIEDLGASLEDSLGRDVDLTVTLVPSVKTTYETTN